MAVAVCRAVELLQLRNVYPRFLIMELNIIAETTNMTTPPIVPPTIAPILTDAKDAVHEVNIKNIIIMGVSGIPGGDDASTQVLVVVATKRNRESAEKKTV